METHNNKHAPRVNKHSGKTNTYTLYWKNGKREVLKGTDVVHALRETGYQAKDLRDLSFFTPGDNKDFKWIESNRSWDWQF